MNENDSVVFLVDDDPSVLKALSRLLKSHGFRPAAYASAQAFLDQERCDLPCCLILDVHMPGLSGLDLQKEMLSRGHFMPVIFLTGHGTIPMSVQAMKEGAVDFLTKPVDAPRLLSAVDAAVHKDMQERIRRAFKEDIQRRLDSLTPREYQVLALVVSGRLNKQIGYELGTSEKTIKVHRGRVMHKMEADSLAELVRLAGRVGISADPGTEEPS